MKRFQINRTLVETKGVPVEYLFSLPPYRLLCSEHPEAAE